MTWMDPPKLVIQQPPQQPLQQQLLPQQQPPPQQQPGEPQPLLQLPQLRFSSTSCLSADLLLLKAGLSTMFKETFKCFVLNALWSKAKQSRIVLRHGIRHNFLEIHLLLVV